MVWNTLIDLDKHVLLALNGSESLFVDGLVKTLTAAPTWIPLYVMLLFLVVKNNDSFKKVLLIVACALLCVFLAGSLNDMFVKPLVGRWRPSHDAEIGLLVDTVNGYRGGNYGFFSSHAANTFSLAVFFSLLCRSRLLTAVLMLWSLTNCWTRMYLGVHFPGDILCGLIWGGIVGVVMWMVCTRLSLFRASKGRFISVQYTSTGYLLTDVDAVVCVFLFTLVYVILRACCYLYV